MTISPAVAKVLQAFLRDPDEPQYGFTLMTDTGLASGSLYPILGRLKKNGWITASTEDIDPRVEGRPARRYYTLTSDGLIAARLEMAAASELLRPPGWFPARPQVEGH
ncbi:PadR family transcriptional regulator [Nonomuraea cypriaca]|nr:PadR family transcriptional regulator [Nonomuraea cypriaca]